MLTDGYTSSINGAAEVPHCTIKNTAQAMLMVARMSNLFWYFAGQYAAFIYNQCSNSTTGKPPALVVGEKYVQPHKLRPWGACVRIIKDLKSERTLSAHTSGDPRILSNNPIDASTLAPVDSPSIAFCGRFMSFGNNKAVMLVLVITITDGITSHKLRCVHHALVDEFGLSADPTDKPLPNELILSKLYDSTFSPTKPIKWKFDPMSSDLDTMGYPYNPSIRKAFQVSLPPLGQAIGIKLVTDEDYIVPILVRVDPAKEIYKLIPL